MAGLKIGEKPQSVPDVHLSGQAAEFSQRFTFVHCSTRYSRVSFNPFTHAVAATFAEDISDSWGAGWAVHVGPFVFLRRF